ATGCGFFFGTLTEGNDGTAGISFCSAAHASAVWRNWSRTFTVLGIMGPPPLPGAFRSPAAKEETVRSFTARSVRGLQMDSNRLNTLAYTFRVDALQLGRYSSSNSSRNRSHVIRDAS